MRHTTFAGFFGLALAALASCQAADTDGRPNFLIIITDDQRYDTMEYMPRTQARIFDEGVTFTSGYVTTPKCGPSRASILTGMYAHNHKANNRAPLLEETFVPDLQEAGYFTGMVGKYMNVWARFEDEPPPPEFDFWVAFGSTHEGSGVSEELKDTFYFTPILNVDGTWYIHQDYLTYVLRDYALQFLDQAEQQQEPFLLILAPAAPHEPADPAPGDEDLYPDLPPHRPPSYNEVDVSDKPAWLESRRPLSLERTEWIDNFRRKQLQSLNALDEAVESLLLELENQGELDNTVVIYLSDNGVFWGEHRLYEKYNLYEEAVRVPFALRYPPLVEEPRVESRLVANIDIAPTIYELAGLPTPPEVDGRSLVPLLEGTDDWREDLFLERGPDENTVQAIHTDRYAYIETPDDKPELYDLATDPYQIDSLSGNPSYAALEADLRVRLEAMRVETATED